MFTETNPCPKSVQAWIENSEHNQDKAASKTQEKQADFLMKKTRLMSRIKSLCNQRIQTLSQNSYFVTVHLTF